MKAAVKPWVGVSFACGALALTAAAALAQQPSESQIPTSGEKVEGAPFQVKRDWGEFKLADRIAEKNQEGRADQLCLLLSGVRHPAVFSAI